VSTVTQTQPPDQAPDRALLAVTLVTGRARAYNDIAAWLAGNPGIAAQTSLIDSGPGHVLIPVSDAKDPKACMADIAARGVAAGAIAEGYVGDEYAGMLLHFGPVFVDVYAHPHLVCEEGEVTTRGLRLAVPVPSGETGATA
jgi:hypothetical protein